MKKVFSRVMILGVFLLTIVGGPGFAFAQSQTDTRFFSVTQQSVSGRFLEYWNENGGLLQQGYPISPVLEDQSAIDGKTYTVQYFERAVFEMHPENPRPYDVELALLGVLAYRQKYPDGAPNQVPNTDPGSVSYPATGKRLGGSFLVYFNQHGGVAQQGLPISDEFQEKSSLDGKVRTVQYFERAVFEWNPSEPASLQRSAEPARHIRLQSKANACACACSPSAHYDCPAAGRGQGPVRAHRQ